MGDIKTNASSQETRRGIVDAARRVSAPRGYDPSTVKRITLTRAIVRLSDAYRRVLATFLRMLGPPAAYASMAGLARVAYWLAKPLREHSEAQCRAAFGAARSPQVIKGMAERAFVHRVWNLTDLMLAGRFICAGSYRHRGGCVPEPYLDLLLHAQRHQTPVILLTAYYGPYDLLPLFLGYNGIRAGAVYRPHGNPRYDAYRNAVRGASGCELITVERATDRLQAILESGGTVAILSDHESPRRGVPVSFLGLPTRVSHAVGLLAEHYKAIVVVAGVRRRGGTFSFEVVVSDVFDPAAWQDQSEPVTYITRRYVAAMERMILGDPAQYLWTHSRWNMKSTDITVGGLHVAETRD